MPEKAGHRAGFSVTGGRQAKAEKIRAVIEAVRGPLRSTDRILDVGAGSGGIAAALGAQATVYATDKTDQRTEGGPYSFVVANERLPFPDGTFDVAISNHVIEHVGDVSGHLAELCRVVKPTGLCYLATPNRWWPHEAHSGLLFLHWLPMSLFNRIAIRSGRLREPVGLQSLRALETKSHELFDVDPWHDRIVLDPRRYNLNLPRWASWLVSSVPLKVILWTRAMHPTLIVILRPTSR